MNNFEIQQNIPHQKEETFKSLSFTREQLDIILNNPKHVPEEVLLLLEKDFKDSLDAGVGVWEEYSLREHTLMVMKQYGKYFKDSDIDDKKLFEFILALHDMGKPKAVSAGMKHKQHEYTKEILTPILTQLGYSANEMAIAESLIDGDPIGSYLKGGDATGTAEIIVSMAKKSGLPIGKFWTLLTTYYQVDAGSYTEDAGGLRSLDGLFSFDPGSHRMTFSPHIAQKIDNLEKVVNDLASKNQENNEKV